MNRLLLFSLFFAIIAGSHAQQIKMDFKFEQAQRMPLTEFKAVHEVGKLPPITHKSDHQFVSYKNGIDSCGVDTLEYLINKNTVLEWYYLADTTFNNGGNVHDYYSRYAQYYDAPQDIDIHGASFYAYLFTAGDSAEVTVGLYTATADSFPDQLVTQTSVWVYDDFNNFNLNVMKQRVSFDSVVTMSQPYLIALETSTTEQLLVLSNSFVNSDGDGEGLGFTYYSNPNFPSSHGWYDQTNFAANWDFDWIIEPAVSYHFDPSFSLSSSSSCEGDSVCIVNTTADSVVRNKMYNQNAPLGSLSYDWGDGALSSGVLEPCHIYSTQGFYDVEMIESFGWTTSCSMTRMHSVTIDPLPNASFSFVDNLGGSITFSDLSSNADSIVWDLGDASAPLTDSSFNYTYAQSGQSYTVTLIAYNDCGSDTATQTVLPDPTSIDENFGATVNIYPNPNKGILHINASNSNHDAIQIELLNMVGEVILSDQMVQRKTISMETLANGVYFVKFKLGDSIATKRVVLNR